MSKKAEKTKSVTDDKLEYVKMPVKLASQVRKMLTEGKIENPSDVTWAQEALIRPEENTESTVKWFQQLIKRKGKRYEVSEVKE